MGRSFHSSASRLLQGESSFSANSSRSPPMMNSPVFSRAPRKVNEHVYEMYNPAEKPDIEVLFFHGFQIGDSRDSYWADWTSADKSQCWLETWLVDEFPSARVLSVSYDSDLARGRADVTGIATNLVSDLIRNGEVGQREGCPVVLVGHSVGGLVMKKLCVLANSGLISDSLPQGNFLLNFFKNLKGMFFYATPHTGSTFFSQMTSAGLKGQLLKDMKILNEETVHLNEDFSALSFKYRWKVSGVGETLITELGVFRGRVVQEASSRSGKLDSFHSIAADHVGICKPAGKDSSSFKIFVMFIKYLRDQAKSIATDDTTTQDAAADVPQWFADPIYYELMVDPVKCNDGKTYDRWTIIEGKYETSPFKITVEEPFGIAFDDIDVQRRLFRDFPLQEKLCKDRREEYREKSLQLSYNDRIPPKRAIGQLENVLKWAPCDVECKDAIKRLSGLPLIPANTASGHLLFTIEILMDKVRTSLRGCIGARVGCGLLGIFICGILTCLLWSWVFGPSE